jgi:prepilin peptidase CpaA
MNAMTILELVTALVVAVIATVFDIRARRIPDWLTYSASALAVGFHSLSLTTLLTSLAGALACAAIPFIWSRLGKVGLGDVKLFLALGAILGPSLGFEVELYAFVLAFPFALVVRFKKLRSLESLPFAPAICAGVLVAGILQR